MRTLVVALAMTLLSGSAYAQSALGSGVGGVPKTSRDRSPEAEAQKAAERKERAESERAYKKALDAIPESSKHYDPWKNVRP